MILKIIFWAVVIWLILALIVGITFGRFCRVGRGEYIMPEWDFDQAKEEEQDHVWREANTDMR